MSTETKMTDARALAVLRIVTNRAMQGSETRDAYTHIAAALEAAEARAEAAEAEIDWIKAQPDDDGRMFAEIEAAAKASYRRHQSSVRGQVLTRADQYESHLVWAALEWAARTKEQQA